MLLYFHETIQAGVQYVLFSIHMIWQFYLYTFILLAMLIVIKMKATCI